MKKNTTYLIILLLATGSILFTGCSEEVEPSLYDPNYVSGQQPVINGMNPSDSTFGGVGNIVISGNNFLPNEPYNEYNQVYFDELKANVLSVTPNEITIASPNMIRDSIQVKIAVRGSDLFSDNAVYKLKAAVDTTFGGLDDLPQKYTYFGVSSDLAGNVYLSGQVDAGTDFGRILKISPGGLTEVYVDKTTFLKANGMKMGPGNKLFATIVSGRLKQVKTIDDAGAEVIYANVSSNPKDLDFDRYGHVWLVALGNIIRIDTDQTVETAITQTLDLKSVRVYNDYLYVAGSTAGSTEQKILRYSISEDGSLGPEETILDAANEDWLSGVTINAITFSADGLMYLGTTASPDALFELDPVTKAHQVVYPGLIKADIYALNWGESNFLFATQQNPENGESNLLKIDLNKLGAPYYGRQ